MNTLAADVRPAKIERDPTARPECPTDLATALALYRQQCEQLEAATDQDEIDRLASESHDLLVHLSGLTAPTAALLAAKMNAIITRHADSDTADLEFLRDARNDACQLASDSSLARAWTDLWHDLGCYLMVDAATGRRSFLRPDPYLVTDRHTGPLPPHLQLVGEDEARGAAKVLQAMIQLGGSGAAGAVFALADTRLEA